MFVDTATVVVHAGDGGNGIVSFRHEKFIDRGGPDGGDGGHGGSVIFRASRNQNTLASFRYQKELKAPDGQSGGKRKKHGRSGQSLIVALPVGTSVHENGEVVADLVRDGDEVVIAEGGKGGFGNAHFVSSTRQAPKLAEKGELGQRRELQLELKSIADVGIVGLPNAGKSTLLARISNARPQIADYAFTTLTPNLGVVDVDKDTSLLFADVPGLIAGASKGKGLGDEFLRHVERTSVLLHLIDAYSQDVAKAYRTIQQELQEYQVDLTSRPQVVVVNKTEGLDQTEIGELTAQLKLLVPKRTNILFISAQSGQGIDRLLFTLKGLVAKERRKIAKRESEQSLPVLRLPTTDKAWKLVQIDKGYMVTGRKIEKFAQRTDFSNDAGVQRLRDIMRKMGIMHELERRKITPGQKIQIGHDPMQSVEY